MKPNFIKKQLLIATCLVGIASGANAQDATIANNTTQVNAAVLIAANTSTIKNQKPSTTTSSSLRTGSQTEQMNIKLKYLDNGVTINADGVIALYNNSFSNGIDGNDAIQMANWDEDVALMRNNTALSIETRDLVDGHDSLFLNIARVNKTTVVYTWDIVPRNYNAPNLLAFMVDKFTNTTTPISLATQTAINFTVTSDAASQVSNRFTIVYRNAGVLPVTITQFLATQKNNTTQVSFGTANEINIQQYEVQRSTDGLNFTSFQQLKANASNTYTATDFKTAEGINFYRIKVIEQNGKTYYSNVIKLAINKTFTNDVVVYPNPIVGNNIGLQLSNKAAGVYQIQVVGSNGQTLLSKSVQHIGGSANLQIPFNTYAIPGVYQLQLLSKNGAVEVKQFIK